jgi:hypothetical protein
VDQNAQEMDFRQGGALLLPARWEAFFSATSDAVIVEGVGLHFEDHDPFHTIPW